MLVLSQTLWLMVEDIVVIDIVDKGLILIVANSIALIHPFPFTVVTVKL